MDDKKQESQKTVVAFVAGLLIGGLLVWVFSASPEPVDQDVDTVDEVDTTQDEELDEDIFNDDAVSTDDSTEDEVATDDNSTSDTATFSVANQPAGMSVSLNDDMRYPTQTGWVVVHEDVNGDLGNALGAARYNTEAGLTPTQVNLLRGTEAGMTYHVVFYSEDGDRRFDLRNDVPLVAADGGTIATTFVAE